MLEMLNANSKRSGAISGRSLRLVGLATPSRPMIGLMEFEVIDSAGRNLCRTAGYTPTITASPAATSGYAAGDEKVYPFTNTIDGNAANDWTKAAYIFAAANGSAYFEYTFGADIQISKWRLMIESSSPPTATGMKLLIFKDGVWKELVGKASSTNWVGSSWREFTELTLA